MEDELRKIHQFITSPHCIFNLTHLDSPSFFHQRLIASYLSLRKTLTKPHPHIIRELHSVSDRSLDSLAQGFLYCCLLESQLFTNVLEYLMVLRVEVWSNFAKNFEILLSDYPESLKAKCRINFGGILTQILSYNVCTPELIEYITKSISNHDFSEDNLAANKQIFNAFIVYIADPQVVMYPEVKGCISHYLMLKACRLLGSPYHDQCLELLKLIWTKFPDEVRYLCRDIVQILQKKLSAQKSTLRQFKKVQEVEKICEEIQALQPHPESLRNEFDLYRQRVFGVLIDRKLQNLLSFIIKEGLSLAELKIQIGWIEKKWQLQKINSLPIIMDLAQWAVTGSDLYPNREIILDWVNKKSVQAGQGAVEEMMSIILSPFFLQTPKLSTSVATLSFLRRMLQYDPKSASEYLIYLVQQAETHRASIVFILTEANSHNLLRFEEVYRNPMIPEVLKTSLNNIVSGASFSSQMQESMHPILVEKNSEEINYDMEGSDNSPIKVHAQLKDSSHFLILQEEFVSLFDHQLTNLLDDPSYRNFIEFFSRVCEVGVSIRKDKGNKNLVETVCRETARVVFTMFNKEFEDLGSMQPYQSSVIFHMLSVIGQDWHRVTHRLEMMKGIAKKIIDLSPIAEVAFWTYFFTYFQYGGANYRSVKSWLVPKQKNSLVIRAIEALTGREETDLRSRAATYGIK